MDRDNLFPKECVSDTDDFCLDAVQVSLHAIEALAWANEITSMNDG